MSRRSLAVLTLAVLCIAGFAVIALADDDPWNCWGYPMVGGPWGGYKIVGEVRNGNVCYGYIPAWYDCAGNLHKCDKHKRVSCRECGGVWIGNCYEPVKAYPLGEWWDGCGWPGMRWPAGPVAVREPWPVGLAEMRAGWPCGPVMMRDGWACGPARMRDGCWPGGNIIWNDGKPVFPGYPGWCWGDKGGFIGMDADALLKQAQALFDAGKLDEALVAAWQAKTASWGFWKTYSLLAKIYEKKGDWANVADCSLKAIKAGSTDPADLELRKASLVKLGLPAE